MEQDETKPDDDDMMILHCVDIPRERRLGWMELIGGT